MRCRAVLILAGLVITLVGLASPAGAEGTPWRWPLSGAPAVSRPFQPPVTAYGVGHRGVDLAATPGRPVLAAGAGRVSYAGLLAGRGVVVVVHGALRTTYEPVAASVRVGTQVAAGAVLGRLQAGHPGCPAAACLHWGLLRGAAYLDPLSLLGRGPSVLLPLTGPVAGSALSGGLVGGPAAGQPSYRGLSGPAGARTTAVPAPVESFEPAGPQRATDQPAWSLRASEAPLGSAALLAMVVGLGLLVRRRPPDRPHRPPDGPAAAAAQLPAPPTAGTSPGVVAVPVDLGAERARRRSA